MSRTKVHRSELETMVNNIEDAKSAGRREGAEACLRFLGTLKEKCNKDHQKALLDRSMAALTKEMQRRLWLPGKDKDNE